MKPLYELGYDECLELLRSRSFGRVAIVAPDGPQIVPVNHVVHEGAVYVRTTPYNALGTYGRNTLVAFEVDHCDDSEQVGWSVVARGRCRDVQDPAEIRRVDDLGGPVPWASGQRTLLLVLECRELTGRRIAPHAGDAAPWPAGRDPVLR